MLSRREFIKAGAEKLAGLLAFSALFPFGKLFADSRYPDLVAMKGGKGPDELFRKGIEYLGGIKSFVSRGQSVLVKPNIGWDRTPAYGANTSPSLVAEIVRQCRKAGAARVFVMDHTCDPWKSCYRNSGIEDAVKSSGGEMVPGNSMSYYKNVSVKNGRSLKDVLVHKVYADSDVIINVPVLKHHSSTGMTASMKNLMGVVWDRYAWHRENLHQCIADFAGFRPPDLTVIDAYNVMTRNGPRGYSRSDSINYRYLFISKDQVAADSAGAMVLSKTSPGIKKPDDIEYIALAGKAGLGKSSMKSMKIARVSVQS